MADKLKVENNEKGFVWKAADFIVKNKIAIICSAAVVVLAVVIIVVASSISNSSKDKAMVRVDALEERFADFSEKSESDADYSSTFDALVADLEKEVSKGSYPSVKSAFLLGEAYYSKKDFAKAYDWYMKAYELNSKTYLASLSILNAAVCKENAGDTNNAFELYQKASEYEEVKAQALFGVGRIYYQQNKIDLAKATFQALADMAEPTDYKALAINILATL